MIELIQTLGPRQDVPPLIYLLIPPPLMEQAAYGMNQTVINSIYPRLLPQIAAAKPAVTGVIDFFVPMGGEFQWDTDPTWPLQCSLEGISPKWPGCGYYCDAQSCDQCHPNDVGYAHMANVLKSGLNL